MDSSTAISQQAIHPLRFFRARELPFVDDGVSSPAEQSSTLADFEQPFQATSSTRLSAAVRLVSSFAAAHIILLGSPTHLFPVAVPSTFLFGFLVYVGALYWRTVRNSAFQERQIIYWLDALWYLAFIGMTGGPDSPFSFFLPFPVLFVSLRWGFAPGIAMAVGSSTALFIMGALSVVMGRGAFTADILLPPTALLVLGYLIATLANSGLAMNRRLASLRAINTLFSPRLNIEQIIDRAVRHLALLYEVDKYALVLSEAGRSPRVYRANLRDAAYRVSDTAAEEIGHALARLEPGQAVIYRGAEGLRRAEIHGLAASDPTIAKKQLANAIAAAHRLDCTGFGAVQFGLHSGGVAQLFVCSNKSNFGPADLLFFRQFAEQLAPRLENVQLLDRLASEVAEHERQKISRDIHDSAIQPYIGLKFGLEALARKAAANDPLARDIGSLVEMATIEISEMRRYVKGLRGQGEPGNAALIPAVRRQASRFGDLYGIKVEVEAAGELRIDDRLADEAFHIVSAALSNIRRHTTASLARIHLSCDTQFFKLKIANPFDSEIPAKMFTPRSIAERAYALDGTCLVEIAPGRDTVVTVEIPLKN
ncbi:MAG: histidine kinase [Nitrospirota bacterium]